MDNQLVKSLHANNSLRYLVRELEAIDRKLEQN